MLILLRHMSSRVHCMVSLSVSRTSVSSRRIRDTKYRVNAQPQLTSKVMTLRWGSRRGQTNPLRSMRMYAHQEYCLFVYSHLSFSSSVKCARPGASLWSKRMSLKVWETLNVRILCGGSPKTLTTRSASPVGPLGGKARFWPWVALQLDGDLMLAEASGFRLTSVDYMH